MAKWARVENNTVVETIPIDPSGRYHPSLVWVQCNDVVSVGDLYDGTKFETPQETSVALEAWRERLVCGPLQIRKALRAANLHSAVTAYVNAADEETQEAWEYASEFKRLAPFILAAKQTGQAV